MTKINKEGWEIKKLGEVCDKASSNIVISKLDENEGEYSLFGASGLVKHIDFYHRDTPYIGIVKDGAGVGRVNIYPAYSSLVGTMQYILPKDECLIEYIKYFLIKLNLAKHVSGATIPHIYFKDYGKELIPVPSKDIQQRIVEELDEINAIISAKKQQLQKLDELAQSIFYNMFGDLVANEKGWEVKKLGEIGKVKVGPFGSMLHKEDYISNGIPLVNPMHMKDFKIVVDPNFTVSKEKAEELANYLLEENDVVFARRGDIGRCVIVAKAEEGYLCGTGSLFVRFTEGIASTYIMYLVRSSSFTKELVNKAQGQTMLNLNSSIVENLNIPLPPLPLQESFAARVSAIEEEKAAIASSIEKTQTLLDARMQEYFG